MFEISKYSSELYNEWNGFLETAKNSTFLFHRDFMDYHRDRFQDYSLLIRTSKGKLCALLPANIKGSGTLISHEGLSYGGLAVHINERLNHTLLYFKAILEYLSQNGIGKLVYKEIPSFYNSVPADEVQYAMFLLNARLLRRDTAIVVPRAVSIPYQKRRFRAINRAKMEGIEIREASDLETFWTKVLLPNLWSRYGVAPVHNLAEITYLKSHFPDHIRQFNAYLKGEIQAGATLFFEKNVIHCQYIAVSEIGRKNGSLDYLFHFLIHDLFPEIPYFDFGICNESSGRTLNHGLLDWKEGFGGRTFSHNFFEVDTNNHYLLDQVVSKC